MRKMAIAAALAASALAMPAGDHGQQLYVRPERREPRPTISRDKRKRRERAYLGGHRNRGPFTPLPFILHAGREDDGRVPVCRPLSDPLPLFGAKLRPGEGLHPHRIALGRDPTCNDCQRALWLAEKKGRRL